MTRRFVAIRFPRAAALLVAALLAGYTAHAQEAGLPQVHLIGTGGTISGGAGGPLDAAALRSALPGLDEVATVTTEDFSRIGSSRMHPELQFQLAERVREVRAERPDLAGIIITHGTDSLEETAFLLDLVLPANNPVVFAAAQRPPRLPDTDGPRNLLDAIRVAASPRARELGVLVVLNGEVHAAREVRKTHTAAVEAFVSSPAGPIGAVDDGRLYLFSRPLRRTHLPTTGVEPNVELVRLTAGGGAGAIRDAVARGVRGIVVETFGRGNVPPDPMAEIEAATTAGIPVVFTTRTGGGRVVLNEAAENAGVISGEDLDGLKARILLSVALGASLSPDRIATEFRRLAGALPKN